MREGALNPHPSCPGEPDTGEEKEDDIPRFGVEGSVSVCIAAICRQKRQPKIFAICDREASSVEFSNEDAVVKGENFHPNWLAMYAGDDVSPCAPILRLIRADLSIEKRPLVERVKRSFEEMYQLYLSNLATSLYLGRYRMSMAEFLQKGKKRFGADIFDTLHANIQRVRLQCQFLVCGFDGSPNVGLAHIFTVRNPGVIEDRTNAPGYWAIGNGAFAAMSTLGFYQQNFVKSLGATYYNVMAAKFMAEKATNEVGEHSFEWQLGKDGKEPVDGGLEVYIRAIWDKQGKPRIPEWFVKDLDAALKAKDSSKSLSNKLGKRIAAAKLRWGKRRKRGQKGK